MSKQDTVRLPERQQDDVLEPDSRLGYIGRQSGWAEAFGFG